MPDLVIQGLYIESAGILLIAEARGNAVRWAVVAKSGETLASGCDTAPGRNPDPAAAAERRVDRLAAQAGWPLPRAP